MVYSELLCEIYTEDDPKVVLGWFHEKGATILSLDVDALRPGKVKLLAWNEGCYCTVGEDGMSCADLVVGEALPWPAVIYDQEVINDGLGHFGSVLYYESPTDHVEVSCDDYTPMVFLSEVASTDGDVKRKLSRAIELNALFGKRRVVSEARAQGQRGGTM